MKKITWIIILAVSLWGCYPAGPQFAEDLDVVYTTFDDNFDFKSKGTYAMPDKIVTDVKIKNGDTTYVYMKDVFAQPIFQAIERNMTANGWTKITPTLLNQPDMVLTPAATTSTTYYYSYWYDWWYGGWYGGSWGWYYPPYYTVSSYTTGSLIMTMADPNSESPIRETPAVWVAAANGLYTGVYDVSRVTAAIDQAFTQSPYLNTK
jgi:hypothetical protein